MLDRVSAPESSDHAPGDTLAWRVEGMDCASCVAKVRTAVERLPGISDVEVNLMAERLILHRTEEGAPAAAIERQISALGYRPTRLAGEGAETIPMHAQGEPTRVDERAGAPLRSPPAIVPPGELRWWRTGKARLVAVLGGLVATAWGLSYLFPREAYWIYLGATLAALVPFGRRAMALARAGSPFSIETLMSVAALGAVAIGAAQEAAIVVLLFAVGELLENAAAGQARAGIRALASLIPSAARRETAAGYEEVAAASLAVGDLVQVRPGDRVPCDGEIVDGRSALDESAVTGESVPVARGPGGPVIAGSINADGVLRVRVTRVAADNTVARIVRLVEKASASRALAQRFVERFARWWTPAAMVAALLVMLVPPLLLGGDWWIWMYRGLALLLIACPCALVISVPAAIASGLYAGARRGLLVKGGAALEAIGVARTVAFDKTGTLTQGKPRVTDVVPLHEQADEERVLAYAASVEEGSAHPLALAIVAAAVARGAPVPPATNARAVPGLAVEGMVGGHRVAVGSSRYAAEAGPGLNATSLAWVEVLEATGKTCAVVLVDHAPLGLIALRDEPRADAAAGIAALRRLGVNAVMLTGDNERTGRAIADTLGLDVRAGLLPADKLREIAALKAQGPVVMVGDGINDAPALAAASVGVAMGGGTDVALETADAALMHERVAGIAELVALSRATLANIRQNVGVAVGLKAVFLVTTLAGLTGLWPAILADTGATVLVTVNALRLLRWRPAPRTVS